MLINQWRIVFVVALLLTLTSVFNWQLHHYSEDYVRAMISASARSSLLLFLLAFTASSLYRLLPSALTQWQLQNRRYLGLSFAFSHFIHLTFIIVLANAFPERMMRELDILVVVVGSLGFLFLIAMTITSFAGPRHWLGERNWKILHLTGSYLLWYIFVHTYTPMAFTHPVYFVAVGLLMLSLSLRIIAFIKFRSIQSKGS
jgi:hypothetical protein